jgi:hypothetical protein
MQNRMGTRKMKIEGVDYEINWKKFRVGTSFFIPCLNPPIAKKIIKEKTDRFGYTILTKVVIVDGVKGLRVWRLKTPRRNKFR